MQLFGRIFQIHHLIFISIILILLDSQPPLECIASFWNVSVKYNSNILVKVSKGAKIRNRYNQVPHLIQDTKGKVTNSQLFICNFMTVVSCLWVEFRSEVCWVAVGGKACAC